MRATKRYLTAFAAIGAVLAFGACEDDDDDMTGPELGEGSIQVVATTSGALVDPDGYTAHVVEDTLLEDPTTVNPADAAIEINGSVTFDERAVGAQLVELQGVAPNCTVAGDNPRSVTVNDEETTNVSFQVSCVDTSGSLEVSVATTGAEPDPDGYAIDIGGETTDVAINGTASFPSLLEGEYAVELTGLAENCTVTGDNPATVTVTQGATATIDFAVDCPTAST